MREIDKVAVIGSGLIGMSWVSLLLARGLTVSVVDPRPAAQDDLATFVETAWPMMSALGLTRTDAIPLPEFATTMDGLRDIDFVIESGPDRVEIKRAIVRDLEAVIDPDVVIASSTTALLASDIQMDAHHPARILVGHPINPPHMVPLVELVGGQLTSEAALDHAEAFFRRLRRVTIRVRKEVVGHIANRLSAALYREAVSLVEQGIGTVEDVDRAIACGPGMRWALMGPHLTYHLGGGQGGLRHYLEHLGPTQEARWADLGDPALTPALKEALVAGIDAELRDQDRATLAERRDRALVELYLLKEKHGL